MTQKFSGNLKLSLAGTFSGANDLSTLAQAINYSKSYNLTNGTGANQANMIFMDQRTLAASTAEDLDLAGSLTNAYGTTITFTSIKGIIVYASPANTNDVLIGGDASAAFVNWVANSSDIIVVKPGGLFALVNPQANGYAVTATTGDLLQIANSSSGTPVTYDIILLGEV
jgi:hypothetical protein